MEENKYIKSVHFYGRIWTVLAILVLIAVPTAISTYNNAWPSLSDILKGLAPVAMLFYPSGIIEVLTFSPLLGSGGTYLSFVTGNISNLKLPCALSSMETAGVTAQSEEGEVISTISIAASSIVTTLIITLFVVLFKPLLPYVTDPESVFAPAFQQVLPALFGALGVSYFSKHLKISVIPLAAIVIVLLISGKIASGILIPIGVVVALASTHIMYKKGKL